jgi:uncharacterized protein (TIGR02246 family)
LDPAIFLNQTVIKMTKLSKIFFFCLLPIVVFSQTKKKDEAAVRAINDAYVKAWLDNNEEKVMSLFEENGSITPSGIGYFKGHDKIRSFWFPKDSSITVIDKFENKIIQLQFKNDVIVAMSNSILSWHYQKGDFKMAKDQEGFALTFYRKQKDGSWKIWKQVWSDLWAKDKG